MADNVLRGDIVTTEHKLSGSVPGTLELHYGRNGATFIPEVSEDGIITWTNDQSLVNPAPVDIRGPQGERGEAGEAGPVGPAGPQGIQGIQGIRGEKGEQGDPGIQGPAGAAGRDGADGKDGYTPVRGTDYWTAEDKREIVEEVAAEMPAPTVSWNDLEDKPFSKEVDSAVYTLSSWEPLPQPLYNAEEYTYGTKLFEADFIPSAVTMVVPDYGWTTTLLLTPIDDYYSLGQFEIFGNKFAVYVGYNGRNYATYALSSISSLYGWTFEYRDFAKISHLPVEYLDIVRLKEKLSLPVTWANLKDKPFEISEDSVGYPINFDGVSENTVLTNYAAEYPYMSDLVAKVKAPPDYIRWFIDAYGHATLTAPASPSANNRWLYGSVSGGPLKSMLCLVGVSGGYDMYVLFSGRSASGHMGSVNALITVTPLDIKALPMDEITSAVISALPESDVGSAVLYTEQTLTEEQKAQARANIGIGGVEPDEDDIPKVFINGTIPTTKDDVLAEMQYISKTESFTAYVKIKCQGSSSMSYDKKNFTVKMYSDEARDTKLEKTFKDWGHASNKFVLKANYVDHTHARNIICANLWNEVVSSRADYDALPEEMRNSPRNGAIDGFPVKVYTNGTYQGIYTWNIGKDNWMWGMNEDNANHILLCGETNTDGVYAENACNFRALWDGVHENHWSVEIGTNSDAVKNSLNALISCVMNTDDATFRSNIGNYLDVQSAIDYYIHQYFICGIDGLARNMLLATYDGVKWYCGAYDMDSTLGLRPPSVNTLMSPQYRCPEDYNEKYSLLWERLHDLFWDEMKARYAELRKSVYTFSNMTNRLERFMDMIGTELYAEDLEIYPGILNGDVSNIKRIREFIRDRGLYLDVKFGGQRYSLENGSHTFLRNLAGETVNVTVTVTDGHIVTFTNPDNVVFDANINISHITRNSEVIDNGNVNFGNFEKYLSLKAGDVVRVVWKISANATGGWTNLALAKAGATESILLGSSGNVSFDNSVTITEDVDVGAIKLYTKNQTDSIDIEIYVNNARYV